MFGLFQTEPTAAESNRANFKDILLDMEMNTTFLMNEMFSNRAIFATFAGAVFTLHQDILLRFGIDMRKVDDALWGAAMDKAQPHVLGDFPTRIGLVVEALIGIDNMNLDVLEDGRAPQMSDLDYQFIAVTSRMRSAAARIWLLTIQSKAGVISELGVANMWLMLQHVEFEELADHVNTFGGTYFTGVRNESPNKNHWPLVRIVN